MVPMVSVESASQGIRVDWNITLSDEVSTLKLSCKTKNEWSGTLKKSSPSATGQSTQMMGSKMVPSFQERCLMPPPRASSRYPWARNKSDTPPPASINIMEYPHRSQFPKGKHWIVSLPPHTRPHCPLHWEKQFPIPAIHGPSLIHY